MLPTKLALDLNSEVMPPRHDCSRLSRATSVGSILVRNDRSLWDLRCRRRVQLAQEGTGDPSRGRRLQLPRLDGRTARVTVEDCWVLDVPGENKRCIVGHLQPPGSRTRRMWDEGKGGTRARIDTVSMPTTEHCWEQSRLSASCPSEGYGSSWWRNWFPRRPTWSTAPSSARSQDV